MIFFLSEQQFWGAIYVETLKIRAMFAWNTGTNMAVARTGCDCDMSCSKQVTYQEVNQHKGMGKTNKDDKCDAVTVSIPDNPPIAAVHGCL